MTSNSTIPTNKFSAAPALVSQICGVCIIMISLLGLLPYGGFAVLVFTRPVLKKSFYRLAGSLGIADCICLLLMICYAGPCTILQHNLSDTKVIGGVLNVGWFSGLPLIVFQATDRYFCICHNNFYKRFYTLRNANTVCLICLAFGSLYSLPSFFECCPLYFDYVIMSWGWDITEDGAVILAYGELAMVVTAIVVTYTLNVLLIRKVRHINRSIQTLGTIQKASASIREKKLFIQFLISSMWLIIFDAPFIAIGYVDPSYWFGFFVTFAYIINCSINGWVYVLMNSVIRKEIKQIFRKNNQVSVISA